MAANVFLALVAFAAVPASSPAASPPASAPAESNAAGLAPWTVVHSPAGGDTNRALRAVFFVDDKLGWAAGDRGLVLRSADGGATWHPLDSFPSDATIRAVLFRDANTGWLCGDGDSNAPPVRGGHVLMGKSMASSGIFQTTDGGTSWRRFNIPTNFELTSLAWTEGNVLLVGNSGGEGHLDGDLAALRLDSKTFNSHRAYRALIAVCVIDANRRVAVGSPVSVGFMPPPNDDLYTRKQARAIYSDDAGMSIKVAEGSEGRGCLRAIAHRKGLPLVAVGDRGAILTSDDFGATWKKADSPTDQNLRAVAWAQAGSAGTAGNAAGKGAASGQAPSTPLAIAVGRGGTVVVSSDGGRKWALLPAPKNVNFTAVAAAGDTFIGTTAEGPILRATANDLANAGG